MSNHWLFVYRGVQLVYDTVGGVELGRNSLKCLQFGGRLTILAERLFNSERSSSVLPCTVICNLYIDLTVKDQVCSQILHRWLDVHANGRRWSWSWGGPCHCQHSSHQSYHDESRPLQSWFVFCSCLNQGAQVLGCPVAIHTHLQPSIREARWDHGPLCSNS